MHTAPLADLLALARSWDAVIGTPDDLVEHFCAYAALGVEEIMLQWYDPTDIAGLRVLASEVMPRLRA
jgi:uncharacterized protein involved in copper resistance